jgi:hypothetical protein
MLITPVTLVYPFHSWQIKLYPRPRARKGACARHVDDLHSCTFAFRSAASMIIFN